MRPRQRIILKGNTERQRPTVRQYLLRLVQLINDKPGIACELDVRFPDASSVGVLVVQRRAQVRSGDILLVLRDYPNSGADQLMAELDEAHHKREDVHVIYCGMSIPFLRWLLLHRNTTEAPSSLPDAVAAEFGEDAQDMRDLNTAAIGRVLDTITLDDVHDAAELHKRLPEHSTAKYHDETFWELPMPELIAELEHLADEGEFRPH